jgi:hypothetical protein
MVNNKWAVIKARKTSGGSAGNWWMVERNLSEGQAKKMMCTLNSDPDVNTKWTYRTLNMDGIKDLADVA